MKITDEIVEIQERMLEIADEYIPEPRTTKIMTWDDDDFQIIIFSTDPIEDSIEVEGHTVEREQILDGTNADRLLIRHDLSFKASKEQIVYDKFLVTETNKRSEPLEQEMVEEIEVSVDVEPDPHGCCGTDRDVEQAIDCG